MTILQHYYTSCKDKGFQTNAVSEGLDKDMILILIRLGLYKPPLSLPSQPTEEEIKKFPISLSYHVLQDNKSVISNSTYVGKDYSGRFGNYFSHSIFINNYDEEIKKLLPIQLWGAPVWVTKESSTEVLPPLVNIKAGSFITIENVNLFLSSGNRLSRLPYLISAALNGLRTRKRIIIVDNNQNIALWIAAISMGLPYDLSKQITFTTYNKDPYNVETLICGTTIDSEFRFSLQDIKFEYSVFDFEENRFSEIEKIDPYIKLVCDLFKDRKIGFLDNFSKFYSEAVSFSPACQYELYGLFSMFSAVQNQAISEDAWQKTINLIVSNDLINLNPNLVKKVIPVFGNVPSAGKALAICAIELHIKTSQEKIDPIIRFESSKAFFNLVFLKYSLSATVSDMEEILEKTKGIRLEILQKEYELRCQELIQGINDVNKKIYLFKYFINTGLITSKSVYFETLLEYGIMPTIAEPAAQRLFKENLNTEFRKSFINAFGKYLSGNLKEQKIHTTLSDFATDELIYSDLVSYSLQHNDIALYLFLYIQYVGSKKEKINLFVEFYKNITKFKLQSNIEGLEKAYSNTWGTSLPTFDEIYIIIETISIQDLYQCSFTDIFPDVVIKNTDFKDPSPKSVKLAKVFLNNPRLSEHYRIILNLIIKIPDLKGDEEDLKMLYDLANSKPFDSINSLNKNLLELFYRKLIIENKQQQIHLLYIKELIKELPKKESANYDAYKAAFNYGVSVKSHNMKVFVDCFKVWNQIPTSKNDFLYSDYKKMFYSQKKKTRKDIENKIRSDLHFRKKWDLYIEKTETGIIVSIKRNVKKLKNFLQKKR